MSKPSAKVIADSISPAGDRLTTIEVTMHRFVLAEFNTHRAFSRNSASSRAIPVAKQIERVLTDPAFPVVWPAEQRGMQGGDELSTSESGEARGRWLFARDAAVEQARAMVELGVHKSITNRLLEPFMWHTAIVSSTEWDNFWVQRCSELAQPEIHAAADAMREAFDASTPREVAIGEWHAPYVGMDEEERLLIQGGILTPDELLKISVARCARVSYLTHDGKRDPKADLDMYDKLVSASPPHASPLEHVATPTLELFGQGNFQGWRQLRHQVLSVSVVGITAGQHAKSNQINEVMMPGSPNGTEPPFHICNVPMPPPGAPKITARDAWICPICEQLWMGTNRGYYMMSLGMGRP